MWAVHVHESWEDFHTFFEEIQRQRGGRLIAFSKYGSRHHAVEGTYQPGDWLLFGAETTGLPDQVASAARLLLSKAARIKSLQAVYMAAVRSITSIFSASLS